MQYANAAPTWLAPGLTVSGFGTATSVWCAFSSSTTCPSLRCVPACCLFGGMPQTQRLSLPICVPQLDMSNARIDAEGAKALAATLAASTSLKSLNLTYNGIGGEGAKSLAEALRGNASLTELNLQDNWTSRRPGDLRGAAWQCLADEPAPRRQFHQRQGGLVARRSASCQRLADRVRSREECLRRRGLDIHLQRAPRQPGQQDYKVEPLQGGARPRDRQAADGLHVSQHFADVDRRRPEQHYR